MNQTHMWTQRTRKEKSRFWQKEKNGLRTIIISWIIIDIIVRLIVCCIYRSNSKDKTIICSGEKEEEPQH